MHDKWKRIQSNALQNNARQWTEMEFISRVSPLVARYKVDSAYVNWWSRDDVHHAWRLYNAAAQNYLGILLLGNAAIRSNMELLTNFGMTTGGALSEDQKIQEEILNKNRRAHGSHQDNIFANSVGKGSVLTDQFWTPILNDSYILGGCHTLQDFHLAEDKFYEFAQSYGSYDPKETFRMFLSKNHEYIWNEANNCPRVLARELIGLSTFGYKPHYSIHDIGFYPEDKRKATRATFEEYINALEHVGYNRNEKSLTIRFVSRALFGVENAIQQ